MDLQGGVAGEDFETDLTGGVAARCGGEKMSRVLVRSCKEHKVTPIPWHGSHTLTSQ